MSSLSEYTPVLEKNNILHFSSELELEKFLKTDNEEEFESKIKEFQQNKFTSLVPILNQNDEKSKQKFLNKKIKRTQLDYKFSGVNDISKSLENEIVDLDDPLIKDDRFASVLNENRSIYVGNDLYVYTTEGIFKTNIKYEDELNELIEDYQEKDVIRQGQKNQKNLPIIGKMRKCIKSSSDDSFDLFGKQTLITTQLTKNIAMIRVNGCGGGCSSGGYDINGVKTDIFNAKTYKNLTLDFYGLARRDGSNYKGKRVITKNIQAN